MGLQSRFRFALAKILVCTIKVQRTFRAFLATRNGQYIMVRLLMLQLNDLYNSPLLPANQQEAEVGLNDRMREVDANEFLSKKQKKTSRAVLRRTHRVKQVNGKVGQLVELTDMVSGGFRANSQDTKARKARWAMFNSKPFSRHSEMGERISKWVREMHQAFIRERMPDFQADMKQWEGS